MITGYIGGATQSYFMIHCYVFPSRVDGSDAAKKVDDESTNADLVAAQNEDHKKVGSKQSDLE